jgi:hypothetical protein
VELTATSTTLLASCDAYEAEAKSKGVWRDRDPEAIVIGAIRRDVPIIIAEARAGAIRRALSDDGLPSALALSLPDLTAFWREDPRKPDDPPNMGRFSFDRRAWALACLRTLAALLEVELDGEAGATA